MVVAGPAGELDVPLIRSVVRVFAPARGEIVIDGEALGLRGDEEDEAPAEVADSTAAAGELDE